MRDRYYDSSIGRFTRRDRYEGSIFNPVSLNKYLYSNGNPVNATDPSGFFTVSDFSVANTIRGTLSEINADTGQNLVLAALGDEPTPASSAWDTALGLGLLVGAGLVFGLASRYAKYSRELTEHIGEVGRKYSFGECDKFAQAVVRDLKKRGIPVQRVRIESRSKEQYFGIITYDGEAISYNGYHEGILVEVNGEQRIFDNINQRGVPKDEWFNKIETHGIHSVSFEPISLD